MGLFGLFKKNTNYFDKNIEPKCAYCEHGKPAKSEGKILCPRSGIVSEDFSCKKFSYSPFMRKPEKEHPLVSSPPEETVSKPEMPANTDKPDIAEAAVSQPDNPVHETEADTTPAAVREKPAESIAAETKKAESPEMETPPESTISDINFTPHDNSENIRKLESVTAAPVSQIENHVQPKEIVLPEVSESSVSSIENTPVKRSSEEYLKSVSAQTVSEIQNDTHTVHKIPDGTQTVQLNELDSK